jgi:hypothetical protein
VYLRQTERQFRADIESRRWPSNEKRKTGQVRETPVPVPASKLQAIFCVVFDCFLAILLNFIDNTGTVYFVPASGQNGPVWL